MEAIVDPELLAPPILTELKFWVQELDALAQLVSDGLALTAPKELRDGLLVLWYAGDHDLGPATTDLVRLVLEVWGRLSSPKEEVLVDNVVLDPCYEGPHINTVDRGKFVEHLGQGAERRDSGVPHAGLLSRPSSWSSRSDSVLVEGDILMRQTGADDWEEPDESEARFRAFLPLVSDVRSLLRLCCDHPCELIQHLALGITAYCVGELGCALEEIRFSIGPSAIDSLKQLNYKNDRRYAAKCIRAMGLVASGRGDELDGHIERRGAGANDEYVRHHSGALVIRSYLANQTPNAHRLFWVKSEIPIFLNVTGHAGNPAL